jgi:hypothetical protein
VIEARIEPGTFRHVVYRIIGGVRLDLTYIRGGRMTGMSVRPNYELLMSEYKTMQSVPLLNVHLVFVLNISFKLCKYALKFQDQVPISVFGLVKTVNEVFFFCDPSLNSVRYRGMFLFIGVCQTS